MAFDKNKYDAEYKKEKYEQISLSMPKGKRQELKDFAATQDISVSELIRRALWNTYKIQI